MKKLSIMILIHAVFLILTAQSSLARQYTQCSRLTSDGNTDLYGVINLPKLEEGTLFLTLGVETDVSSLYKIQLKSNLPKTDQNSNHTEDLLNYVFITTDSENPIEIYFPKAGYNKRSDNLEVVIKEGSYDYIFKCFSRIYDDSI